MFKERVGFIFLFFLSLSWYNSHITTCRKLLVTVIFLLHLSYWVWNGFCLIGSMTAIRSCSVSVCQIKWTSIKVTASLGQTSPVYAAIALPQLSKQTLFVSGNTKKNLIDFGEWASYLLFFISYLILDFIAPHRHNSTTGIRSVSEPHCLTKGTAEQQYLKLSAYFQIW